MGRPEEDEGGVGSGGRSFFPVRVRVRRGTGRRGPVGGRAAAGDAGQVGRRLLGLPVAFDFDGPVRADDGIEPSEPPLQRGSRRPPLAAGVGQRVRQAEVVQSHPLRPQLRHRLGQGLLAVAGIAVHVQIEQLGVLRQQVIEVGLRDQPGGGGAGRRGRRHAGGGGEGRRLLRLVALVGGGGGSVWGGGSWLVGQVGVWASDIVFIKTKINYYSTS